MKIFFKKTLIFSLFLAVSFMWILSRANGFTDPFYLRFTTPKQSNLILGTSRAAQDIRPNILNNILGKSFYNYSFTVAHSPYGSTYLKSIKKKLNRSTTNGIFILTVDPWSISSWTKDPNDYKSFRELELCVGNTIIVNLNPNLLYLLFNWKEKHLDILKKKDSNMFLHHDGWLEITIDMDSIKVSDRIKVKEKSYREGYLPYAKFSEHRLNTLEETIRFLKNHGEVYLVRLPIHPKIMQIEYELMPDFNDKIKEAISISSGYLDLTIRNNNYKYTDGNHLYKDSATEVSRIIGEWLLEQK